MAEPAPVTRAVRGVHLEKFRVNAGHDTRAFHDRRVVDILENGTLVVDTISHSPSPYIFAHGTWSSIEPIEAKT